MIAEMSSRTFAAEQCKCEFREVSAMSMKTMFLALSIALTLLAGCGRSKPESSKTARADGAPAEETAPAALPPDQLPPKPAPASSSQPVVAQPRNAIPFAPLPPDRDPAAAAERRKADEVAAKQADAVQRELEQRRILMQNQPEEKQGE